MFRLAISRAVMAVEIEAKMRIEDTDGMIAALKDLGATLIGDFLEQNLFYDTHDRTLLAADEGLRIRTSLDLNTGVSRTVLTHKGPNGYGPLKNREETEVGVDSPEAAGQIVERLGYRRWLGFEKRRQSWTLDGCRIELDQVPYLGSFIEIEGSSEQCVLRMRERLGLASVPLIKASYVAMLTSYLQERGQPLSHVRFTDRAHAPIAKAG